MKDGRVATTDRVVDDLIEVMVVQVGTPSADLLKAAGCGGGSTGCYSNSGCSCVHGSPIAPTIVPSYTC